MLQSMALQNQTRPSDSSDTDLVDNVMSQLFNMLSRLNKEQASFNFMATVTICSDFGAQENSLSVFPLFPLLFAMK